MSNNNIYNILNNFDKIAKDTPTPAASPAAKSKLQESMEQVVNEKYMGFKKVAAAAKAGGAENPEAVAASIGRKKYGKEKFQKAAAAGKKLGEQLTPGYPTPAMDKQKQTHASLKQMGVDPDKEYPGAVAGAYSKDEQGQKKYIDRTTPGVVNTIKDKLGFDKPDTAYAPKAATGNVKEVAPPGAKAERMVKHVKKGYAKDGKLTPKEKSIAYATAWKAHNKGKVEEAIQSLLAAGFTKEQIVEGWEDMMKAADKRANEKGTGKFDKKQISTGTVYTRKYDPKSGETDDSENVTAVKKGRGRPKKSAFESYINDFEKGLNEGTVYTAKMGQPPQDIDGRSATPTPKTAAPKTAPADLKNMGTAAKAMMAPNYVDPKAKVLPSDPEGVKEQSGPAHSGLKDPSAAAKYDSFMQQRKNDSAAMIAKINPATTKEDQELDEADAEMEGMRKLAGLKGGQKKLDKDHDGKLTGNDFAMLRKGLEEEDMEEGNAFSGAVAKAKADGVQPGEKITVGGKEYDLKESDDDLNQIRRIAGLQECGMSPISGMASDMQDDQGRMNISTNQSSDGTKSVTISAEGDAASSLMQMLKLAGMSGDHVQQQEEPAGVMVVAQDDGEEVDEAKDERYHASTTPDEQVSPVQAQTKGGNGDVAGQEKKMKPGGYQFGDNNHAMQESARLMREYNSIKITK
jgi:hypothetical protein